MIDIHTHLHFKDYDTDRNAVITRAREAGVEKMILVGTDIESSRVAIELAEQHDFLFVSVGIHPHEYNRSATNSKQITEDIESLKESAKHPKVVAIGECGLDYFVRSQQSAVNNQQSSVVGRQSVMSDGQKVLQKKGLLAQMAIAKEFGLPLIIHTRPSAGTMDAYEDMFGILSDSKFEIRNSKFILHCYQGDTEITKKFLGLPNVYFSFTGSITYPVKKMSVGTKDDPVEVLKMVPMERIFVETDCPYLTPQPMRGSRNEPAFVRMTTGVVAAIRAVSEEEIDRQIGQNALWVFGRK